MSENYKIHILSIELDTESLPKQFRLFKLGKNESEKGTFILSEKSVKTVLSNYTKQNRKLSIDYDHASLEKNPTNPVMASIAAGWFNLRQDPLTKELMAYNVIWTAKAKEFLKNQEYKYISPAFVTNEDGEIIRIINAALTNNPALWSQEELTTYTNVLNDLLKLEKTNIIKKQGQQNMSDTETQEKSADELMLELEEAKNQLKAFNKEKVDALILSAIKETKLDPKNKSFAEEMAEKDGIDRLKKYLNTLNPRSNKPLTASIVQANVESVELLEDKSNDPMTYELSMKEELVRDQLGLSKKKFIKNMIKTTILSASHTKIEARIDFPKKGKK